MNTEYTIQANRSLQRLIPRLEARFSSVIQENPDTWRVFKSRLEAHFESLFSLLVPIYGSQYDFFYHLEELLYILFRSWLERPVDIKTLDMERETNPDWFQSNQMLGGVCYVDLFAGNLKGIQEKVSYFKDLGLTYLHLMPLFKAPEGENDGGYAISSYREVDARVGSMDELRSLASCLRAEGISLVVDFVFNHTSNEHEWALKARAGDPQYQSYYYMFENRATPDAYERTLREIFPDEHPGAFSYFKDVEQWVWTTFHSYQWDLNYSNPEVFNRMAAEMLYLSNQGVEVLRLDAVAFIWKQMGTSCENLPQAHQLIRAFNAVARIAAPTLLFKSEAIVHPDDVAKYISPAECQISYNPLLMALLWEALATRKVDLLQYSMQRRLGIAEGCAWVNYIRCHDDIGWTFSDEDAAEIGIDGLGHRRFLNAFYTGQFEGSFARGLPFQFNPKTGDCRISGTCASLAGLEKAVYEETEAEVNLAIKRILLMHSVILSIGGIPLIYLNDERGQLNDYGFRSDASKASDSRWVHRAQTDWEVADHLQDQGTLEGKVFQGLRKLISIRKCTAAFSGSQAQVLSTGLPGVFSFIRTAAGARVMVLCNFTETQQKVNFNQLRLYGLGYDFLDLVENEPLPAGEALVLGPYDFIWLKGV
jgi:amylosucrase